MGQLFSIPPVDDRGQTLNFTSFDDARSLFRKNPTWRIVLPIGLGLMGLCTNLLFRAIGGTLNWGAFFSPLALLGLCAGALLAMFLTLKRSRVYAQSTSWDRIPSSCAWLVAHQRCGACGYELATARADPDGCVACPECGAAWHEDRFTMAGRDPGRSPHSLIHHAHAELAHPQTAYDDRRVPFDAPLSLSALWRASSTTPQHNLALFEQRMSPLNTSLVRSTALLALSTGAGIIITAVLVSDHTAAPAVAATMLILLLGTPAAILIVKRHRTHTRLNVRSAALFAGLCPHCGTPFPPPGRPDSFDGCSPCASCGRAWRSEAIRNRPPIHVGD